MIYKIFSKSFKYGLQIWVTNRRLTLIENQLFHNLVLILLTTHKPAFQNRNGISVNTNKLKFLSVFLFQELNWFVFIVCRTNDSLREHLC